MTQREQLFPSRITQHQIPVPVKNNSGEDIPPYACMYIDPAEEWIERPEHPFGFEIPVIKPNEECENKQDPTSIIFNNGLTINDGRKGSGTVSFPTTTVVLGDPVAGDTVGPVRDDWFMWRGGLVAYARQVKTKTVKYMDGETEMEFDRAIAVIEKGPMFSWAKLIATIDAIDADIMDENSCHIYFRDSERNNELTRAVRDDDDNPIVVSASHAGPEELEDDAEKYRRISLMVNYWAVDIDYCG